MIDIAKHGYKGEIPKAGVYFDRVDVDGEVHSRTYYKAGQQVVSLVAIPDVDRPGKWTTGARWKRRGLWLTHGWGPLDTEAEALAMMDAVGIGVEAMSAGATYLGNLTQTKSENESDENVGSRVRANEKCVDMAWKPGTVLQALRWPKNKTIVECTGDGVELSDYDGNTYTVHTFPSDVSEVKVSV